MIGWLSKLRNPSAFPLSLRIMSAGKLQDTFGRVHDYLRISLTERCNLRCFYCMPEEGIQLRDKAEFMTAEETIAIAQTFVNLGVKKIRLTGGEPLIKRNAGVIMEALGKMPVELTLTTNGVLVDRYIDDFRKAGLHSINVSLDSLDPDRFNRISRRSYFTQIRQNIDLLLREGFHVKINVVVMRHDNDHEIADFVEWTLREPVHVRFIEFMPFDGNNWNWGKKVSYREILDAVNARFGENSYAQLEPGKNDTSRNFALHHAPGTFGIISTVTNPFCDTCNRIRLTADGKVKNCLFSHEETDLLTAYRSGQNLEALIRQSIFDKKAARAGHPLFTDETVGALKNRSMTTIGG